MDYNQIIQRRLGFELKKFKSFHLSNYFQLKKNIQVTLHPVLGRRMTVTFLYHKPNQKYEIEDLPEDLNQYIRTFLCDKEIKLEFEIWFFNSYPFDPPQWKLKNISFRGFSDTEKKNVRTFVTYKLQIHNDRLEDICIPKPKIGNKWSPVITIDKDILKFYTTIHCLFQLIQKYDHFDCI